MVAKSTIATKFNLFSRPYSASRLFDFPGNFLYLYLMDILSYNMLYFVHLLNNVNYFMKTGIIIQAMIGSKRLKNKIFEKIYKKTIIEHVIFQVKKTNFKKIIIVATSKKKKDRKILKYVKKEKVNFFLDQKVMF